MDIPDLVQQALGDEEIQAGVSMGDEDAVCLTPTRTLVYNGEGLLSDEQVSEFSHDVEQIYRKQGRRKTKFVLEYIDGQRSFSVPSNRSEKVLELLLEGVLRMESVIDSRESLVGVYMFSELTLVIAEGRLIKHIGEPVWNEDFEAYPFDDVTGLEFERGSVATSIVLSIDGRPQRVKVPNDNAPIVRQDLEKALFAYYDVSSLADLNREVSDGTEDAGVASSDDTDEFSFGSGIDPLVTDHGDEVQDPIGGGSEDAASGDVTESASGSNADSDSAGSVTASTSGGASADAADASSQGVSSESQADSNEAADEEEDPFTYNKAGGTATGEAESASDSTNPLDGETDAGMSADEGTDAGTGGLEIGGDEDDVANQTGETSAESAAGGETDASTIDQAPDDSPAVGTGGGPEEIDSSTATAADEPLRREDLAAVADRMEELTDAVDRQNELLKRQHRAIKQLAEQLQSE